jgi:hypothetical protein
MPWKTTADVARHNKAAAKSPGKAKKWRKRANALLREGHSEASSIKLANWMQNRDRSDGGRAKRMYG